MADPKTSKLISIAGNRGTIQRLEEKYESLNNSRHKHADTLTKHNFKFDELNKKIETLEENNEILESNSVIMANKIEALESNLREIIQILVDEDYSSIIPQLKKLLEELKQ